MASNQTPMFVESISSFEMGMNSGIAPILLNKNQLAFANNCTVRGAFISHRPAFRKVVLNYNDTFTGLGLFQGAGFYQDDYGNSSIVASISGKLFKFSIGTIAVASDISIVGDLNSDTAVQSWLWQSENFLIVNDGINLPIFYDGNISRRSLGDVHEIETISFAAGYAIPAIGSTVTVQVSDIYTGPVNVLVTIGTNPGIYQILSSGSTPGTYGVILTNGNDTPGNVVPSGTSIVVPEVLHPSVLIGQVANSFTAHVADSGTIKNRQVRIFGSEYGTNHDFSGDAGTTIRIISNGGEWFNFIIAPNSAVSDGVGYVVLPLVYPTVSTSKNFNNGNSINSVALPTTPSYVIGNTVADYVVPALGDTVDVELTQIFNGTDGQSVTVLGKEYTIAAGANPVSTNTILLLNIDATAGVAPADKINDTDPIYSTAELPIGRMGAYGIGRNWMSLSNGRTFVGSDLVGSASGTSTYQYRDAVLKITENTKLAGGGFFSIPGNNGDEIRAMVFSSTLDSSLGQGPLQVFTPQRVFSCNTPIDNTTWQDLESPILTQSLITNGGLSQNSTIVSNGDIIFRSIDGLRSLILARREFSTWGNTPISREITRILKEDDSLYLQYGSAVVFDNRLLMTCKQIQTDSGVIHRGLISLNLDPLSSMAGKYPSVYDGLWTGMNVLQILTGMFDGIERCFAFGLNQNSNKIELYEILKDDESIVDSNGENQSITWSFETGCLFLTLQGKDSFDTVQLQDGEFRLCEVQGTVDYSVYYKPQFHPCWTLWKSGQICAEGNPQNRVSIGIGKPSSSDCDETNNRPLNISEAFQVKFVFTGSAKFYGAQFKASLFPKPEFERVICGATQCKSSECIIESDYDLYELEPKE